MRRGTPASASHNADLESDLASRLPGLEREAAFEFLRSSGPGGQNVNKVSTAVRLRFDITQSASLPEDVKQRLVRLAGGKVTREGVLLIEARRFRTQDKNRQDALERLRALVRRAAIKPKRRKRTRPTANSRERRLEAKRRRAALKRRRSSRSED
ncbi:MAG: alternative ribosome rescue aminoacyl-tRNA hydrolase ArfB [bacterium]